jgi:AAA family ATP:ADP antiporter
MNDVFSVDQSKRLYAIIGYGGLTGGAVGSIITSYLVPMLGTANLFIVALLIFYPSIWCMKYIHHHHFNMQPEPENEAEAETEGVEEPDAKPEEQVQPPRPWDGMLAVYRTPILIFMALEMFLFTFSSTLFYQQLYEMINQVFARNTDATTEFFADFFGKITIISLVSQFFITKLVMMIPNPVLGLMIMPFIQFAASAVMLISPALGIVSWGLIINNAINYSTGRAIRELIYIPLNREQKYQGKGFIDTVVFRLGDGLSSVILIGGLELFTYGMWIDWTILISMAVQFYVIINIARLYSQTVKHIPKSAK